MNFLNKLFRNLFGYIFWILAGILYLSPYGVRRFLGILLGILWFDIFRIRRDVVLQNIQRAFPELTYKDQVKIGRRSLWNLGTNFIEYSLLPFLNSKNVDRFFRMEQMHHLDQALEHGKGVLMLTLHLGHGDLALGALSLKGYPMIMVSKFFKLKWLNDLWFRMRERLGTQFVPPRDSSFQILRGLKAKKAVVIPLDQFTGPPIGVRTQFFGHETGTAAGLATMAIRSGAKVVPVYTFRDSGGVHVIRALPEVDLLDEVLSSTQKFNDILEKLVVEHPDQWMWIHKRWKKFVE